MVFALLVLSGCEYIASFMTRSDMPVEMVEQVEEPAKTLVNPYQQNKVSVSDSVQAQFKRALQLMSESNWSQAETLLRDLIEQQPTLSGPILNLAMVKQQQGDLSAAERYYQQAIATNKNNIAAYNRYAVFLRQQGSFKKAEQYYQQALIIWPHSAETHRNVGILYDLYMGQLANAQHHYQQYLQLRERAPGFDADKTYKQVKGWDIDLGRRLRKRRQ
jgi:Tfp pilus assembly protein PilF